MRPFEVLAIAYFSLLCGALVAGGRARARGWVAIAAAAALTAVVFLVAPAFPGWARDWLGHLYLLAGYWIPGLAARRQAGSRFEAWLSRSDARWAAMLRAVPGWLAHAGELAYLLCYPFVPAAFLVVWTAGSDADVDRFWVGALLGGFACYASLPWLVARPPRLMPGTVSRSHAVARLNVTVLSRLSHDLTTFPSGHVAVAVAAALCVAAASGVAGVAFGLVALGIATGAVTGRYHYMVDVTTGAAVGLLSAIVAFVAVPAQPTTESAGKRRIEMVEQQIAARGVTDRRVLDAMRKVPRERFVPAELAWRAYDDRPLPIGGGQTISQPYIVAYMTAVLRPAPSHRVLEIGTGSGYQAAVLGELAREVYTIEIVRDLARRATATLDALGYRNVHVREGDGYAGWPEHAPFDRILVTAAPEKIPQPLLDQLARGGLLVAPVGAQGATQWIVIAEKTDRGIVERRTIPVQFVPFTRR
jgi:protein-L-isoaspartate(D-aspartate) O-methyltransferase